MAYTAVHRHARISAQKVRPLADLVRGKRVDDALAILKYQPNRGAPNRAGLKVVEVKIDGGPMFKRVRPRARGMAHVIKKRFAHITVAVE